MTEYWPHIAWFKAASPPPTKKKVYSKHWVRQS